MHSVDDNNPLIPGISPAKPLYFSASRWEEDEPDWSFDRAPDKIRRARMRSERIAFLTVLLVLGAIFLSVEFLPQIYEFVRSLIGG